MKKIVLVLITPLFLLVFLICALLSIPFLAVWITFDMFGEVETGDKIMKYAPIELLMRLTDKR